MHKIIYETYSTILKNNNIKYNKVLEIGTPNNKDESLLFLPSLKHCHRIGADLSGPYFIDDIEVIKTNATNLPFDDGYFDLVLCNSVLEHEAKFWLIIYELKRVLISGGLLIIGVPSFGINNPTWVPMGMAITLHYHPYPDDYYRFSKSAVYDIFLDGLINKKIIEIMQPPRVIGYGFKA